VNENCTGVGNRFGHRVKIIVIRGDVSAALVMDMLGRMIRMQNEPFDVCRAEMKYTCFAVIYPDHGMIMMLGHRGISFCGNLLNVDFGRVPSHVDGGTN
jgi:hypothetical protein